MGRKIQINWNIKSTGLFSVHKKMYNTVFTEKTLGWPACLLDRPHHKVTWTTTQHSDRGGLHQPTAFTSSTIYLCIHDVLDNLDLVIANLRIKRRAPNIPCREVK